MKFSPAFKNLFLVLVIALVSLPAIAQYDDVYYDPGQFSRATASTTTTTSYDDNYDNAAYDDSYDVEPYDASNYDSEPFGYDDYSGFEYTSRVRRFRNPYAGFGYYDPVYVDQIYYGGGFQNVGTTVLIYNSPNNFNSFNRFNRFNNGFYGFNSFNRFNRFNRWNDPFFNPYGGGANAFGWGAPRGAGFFGNNFGGGGFNQGFVGGGYYCPPTWGNGQTFNTPNAVNTAVNRAPATRPGTRATGTRGTSTRTPSTRTPSSRNDRSYRDINNGSSRSSTTRPSRTRGNNSATQSRSRTAPTTTRPSRTVNPNSTRSSRPSTRPTTSRPSRSISRPSTTPSRSPRTISSPSRISTPRSSGGSSRGSSSRRPN